MPLDTILLVQAPRAVGWSGRRGRKKEKTMSKDKMDSSAARRIQGNADKTGRNQDFKQRAQRAAAKNTEGGKTDSRMGGGQGKK